MIYHAFRKNKRCVRLDMWSESLTFCRLRNLLVGSPQLSCRCSFDSSRTICEVLVSWVLSGDFRVSFRFDVSRVVSCLRVPACLSWFIALLCVEDACVCGNVCRGVLVIYCCFA